MAPVALAFAVLHIDGSASALALVLTGRTVATIVFLLIGGVVADRFSRRLVLQVSHVITALSQGAVAWLIITGRATVTSVLLIEVVNGAVSAFTMPAMQGVVPQLVGRPLLQQANALMSFAQRGTSIIGPALAGLIVVGPGPGWALAIDALCFALASLALTRVRIPRAERGGASMIAELREGWSEFTARTWLWVIVVAFGLLNAIHVGAWNVLGPVIAKAHPEQLGERGWGLVLSAEAVGAVLMTMVLMRGNLRRPLRAGMLAICALAPALMALGAYPHTWLLVVLACAAGMGMEVFGTGWNVAMMENVPTEALSRVYSYDMLGSFVAMPIGTMVYGWLAAVGDIRTVALASGVAYAAIALATLVLPSVRTLGRADEASGRAVTASR